MPVALLRSRYQASACSRKKRATGVDGPSFSSFGGDSRPQPTSPAQIFQAKTLAYYLVAAVLSGFVWTIMLTPGAFIYQRLTSRIEDVF